MPLSWNKKTHLVRQVANKLVFFLGCDKAGLWLPY